MPFPTSTEPPMSLSMHAASVPVFQQMLGSLDAVLAKNAKRFKVKPVPI